MKIQGIRLFISVNFYRCRVALRGHTFVLFYLYILKMSVIISVCVKRYMYVWHSFLACPLIYFPTVNIVSLPTNFKNSTATIIAFSARHKKRKQFKMVEYKNVNALVTKFQHLRKYPTLCLINTFFEQGMLHLD